MIQPVKCARGKAEVPGAPQNHRALELMSPTRTLCGQVGPGAESCVLARPTAPLGLLAVGREEGESDAPVATSLVTIPIVSGPLCSPKFWILPAHCLAQGVTEQLASMMPQLILEVWGV